MIPYPIKQIDADVIRNLLGNTDLSESSARVEYKEAVPTDAESAREPFLGAICSFANTIGGDVVVGIRAEGGVPVEITGVDIQRAEEEQLKLDSVIRSGMEPPLSAFEIRPVRVDNACVFVIRVGTSWNRPHRVKRNRHFYGRTSAGKSPLTVEEIKRLFLVSESHIESIRNFRLTRLTSESPVPLIRGPKIVLHLTPLGDQRHALLRASEMVRGQDRFAPLFANCYGYDQVRSINFDGLLVWTRPNFGSDKTAVSYAQLFRSGRIEAVDSDTLKNGKDVPGKEYEQLILKGVRDYLAVLSEHRVPPPFLAFLTLLGIRGYHLRADTGIHGAPIDHDNLVVPEVLIESYDTPLDQALRPAFDQIWNASGVEASPHFTDDDRFK